MSLAELFSLYGEELLPPARARDARCSVLTEEALDGAGDRRRHRRVAGHLRAAEEARRHRLAARRRRRTTGTASSGRGIAGRWRITRRRWRTCARCSPRASRSTPARDHTVDTSGPRRSTTSSTTSQRDWSLRNLNHELCRHALLLPLVTRRRGPGAGAEHHLRSRDPDARSGHRPRPGDAITTPDEIGRYLEALAKAAPDRTRLVKYATSWEGRPLHYLVVGSPERIARLDEVKRGMQVLASGAPEADRLIAELPVVVWLLHGVHGNEISSSDAALARRITCSPRAATRTSTSRCATRWSSSTRCRTPTGGSGS